MIYSFDNQSKDLQTNKKAVKHLIDVFTSTCLAHPILKLSFDSNTESVEPVSSKSSPTTF